MADQTIAGPNDHANTEFETAPTLEDLTKATGLHE